MLSKIVKKDKNGNTTIDYKLYQGDTFTQNIQLFEDKDNITPVDISNVEKIIFKFGDYDYNEIFNKEYTYRSAVNKYSVSIESSITADLDVDTYRYQVVVEYISGRSETILYGKFSILDSIDVEG